MLSRTDFLRHVTLALAACSALSTTAGAATPSLAQTIAPGNVFTLSDPAGSGRTADITFVSGTGVFALSNGGISDDGLTVRGTKPATVGGLIATMNVGRVALTPLDGATITERAVTLASGSATRGVANINARVSNITIDASTGDVLAANAIGGAIEAAPYIENTIDGGEVHFSNLSFDLPNKLVYADVAFSPLQLDGSSAPLVTHEHIAMWTVDSISGPTNISPAGVLAAAAGDFSILQSQGITIEPSPAKDGRYVAQGTTVFHDLRATAQGFDDVSQGLGLPSGSIGNDALAALNLQPRGWGTITSTLYFSMAVPEPATYTMTALGLVGILLASRQKNIKPEIGAL